MTATGESSGAAVSDLLSVLRRDFAGLEVVPSPSSRRMSEGACDVSTGGLVAEARDPRVDPTSPVARSSAPDGDELSCGADQPEDEPVAAVVLGEHVPVGHCRRLLRPGIDRAEAGAEDEAAVGGVERLEESTLGGTGADSDVDDAVCDRRGRYRSLSRFVSESTEVVTSATHHPRLPDSSMDPYA